MTFKKNTDWSMAVWARGTTCQEAKRLAWDFRDGRYGVKPRYRCVSRVRQSGHAGQMQAHTDYRCVRKGSNGRVVVTMAAF